MHDDDTGNDDSGNPVNQVLKENLEQDETEKAYCFIYQLFLQSSVEGKHYAMFLQVVRRLQATRPEDLGRFMVHHEALERDALPIEDFWRTDSKKIHQVFGETVDTVCHEKIFLFLYGEATARLAEMMYVDDTQIREAYAKNMTKSFHDFSEIVQFQFFSFTLAGIMSTLEDERVVEGGNVSIQSELLECICTAYLISVTDPEKRHALYRFLRDRSDDPEVRIFSAPLRMFIQSELWKRVEEACSSQPADRAVLSRIGLLAQATQDPGGASTSGARPPQ